MATNQGGQDDPCEPYCSWSPVAEDPAMATAAQVIPSPQARTLFNEMAVLAQPLGGDLNTLHIDVGNVLAVACQRARRGQDAGAPDEVAELRTEQWITPAPEGGWYLG